MFHHVDEDIEQTGLEPREDHLCFRVAEARVVFQQLWTFRSEHQAGIENSRIGILYAGLMSAAGRSKAAKKERALRRPGNASDPLAARDQSPRLAPIRQ